MITDTDITKLKKTFATKKDFKKLEGKFDNLEGRFDTIADYVVKHDGQLKKINEKLDRIGDIDGKFDKIMMALDVKTKKDEEFKSEQASIHHKLERHDTWFNTLSQGTGVLLPA